MKKIRSIAEYNKADVEWLQLWTKEINKTIRRQEKTRLEELYILLDEFESKNPNCRGHFAMYQVMM